MNLERGPGWSGQASWWYAEDTANPDAAEFVTAVRALMDAGDVPPVTTNPRNREAGRKGRAGSATEDPYQRYVREYEITVHPRHDQLQKRFMAYLAAQHCDIEFPACVRDDLRYAVGDRPGVMVEVKPTDGPNLRFAIRAAMGQLLDYRQDQDWAGPQLIVVETEVARTDDLRLAFDNASDSLGPRVRGSTSSGRTEPVDAETVTPAQPIPPSRWFAEATLTLRLRRRCWKSLGAAVNATAKPAGYSLSDHEKVTT